MKEYQLGTAHLRTLVETHIHLPPIYHSGVVPSGSIFVVAMLSFNGRGELVGCMAKYPDKHLGHRFFPLGARGSLWEFA